MYHEDGKRQFRLYEHTPNGFSTLLDPNSLLPADADYQYLPSQLLASGDTIAFSANAYFANGGIGFFEPLFVNRNGVTERLVKRGDTLDGRRVSFVFPLQFTDGRLSLGVGFTDNTVGYYSAQAVPEPGLGILLLIGSIGAGKGKRRKKAECEPQNQP